MFCRTQKEVRQHRETQIAARREELRQRRKLTVKIGYPVYSLYGLRRNATIELLEAGCTPDEMKAITGHITTQMIEKYGREV